MHFKHCCKSFKNTEMKYKRKEIDYVHISMLSIINAEIRNGWELTSLTYRNNERVRLKFRQPK